jgi:hypothetical protein
MKRRNVLVDGEPPPAGDTDRFVEIPKGNDRMLAIELRNSGAFATTTSPVPISAPRASASFSAFAMRAEARSAIEASSVAKPLAMAPSRTSRMIMCASITKQAKRKCRMKRSKRIHEKGPGAIRGQPTGGARLRSETIVDSRGRGISSYWGTVSMSGATWGRGDSFSPFWLRSRICGLT